MPLPSRVSAQELAKVLGLHERSVRQLQTKRVLKRDGLAFDLVDSVQSHLRHLAASGSTGGAYAVARAD
jgi:hypothetical protein